MFQVKSVQEVDQLISTINARLIRVSQERTRLAGTRFGAAVSREYEELIDQLIQLQARRASILGENQEDLDYAFVAA